MNPFMSDFFYLLTRAFFPLLPIAILILIIIWTRDYMKKAKKVEVIDDDGVRRKVIVCKNCSSKEFTYQVYNKKRLLKILICLLIPIAGWLLLIVMLFRKKQITLAICNKCGKNYEVY